MFKKAFFISTVVALIVTTASARGGHYNSGSDYYEYGDYNTPYNRRGNNHHNYHYRGGGNCKGNNHHNYHYRGGGNYNNGQGGNGYGRGYDNNRTSIIDISTIPLSELTDTQKTSLTFMIEEEKLARDVYLYLYNLWGSNIFSNIAEAEQRHMNAIKALLDKYSLNIPSTLDKSGEFENSELQDLYNTLIEKGKLSLIDALEVGVLIEETDISDLEAILNNGVPSDFEITYKALVNGSYNHLNAFNSQLGR
jgi:hypothetical protein